VAISLKTQRKFVDRRRSAGAALPGVTPSRKLAPARTEAAVAICVTRFEGQ